jgi:hypothetical protein
MKERNPRCSCGSNLKAIELDNKGNPAYVICIGIGCSKKYPYRREEDKGLFKLPELKQIYNGG